MKPRLLIITALLLGLAIVFINRESKPTQEHKTSPENTPSSSAKSPPSPAIDTTNTDPRFTRFLDGRILWQASFTTSRKLHQTPDPKEDLHLIEQLFSHYRLVYQENPVGTDNAEITAALLGENPKNVFFLDPDLPALSTQGELLDRWGSPYVFHSLKADLMDIRSPGPDRQLWTDDDLSLGYQNAEAELRLRE